MKLPNAENAIVEIGKLRDYCLSNNHPLGKHKAYVFQAALGLTAEDADELRQLILQAAQTLEATSGEFDEYGQRYSVDFSLRRWNKKATVRSTWIIRSGETRPRLTSCYVL